MTREDIGAILRTARESRRLSVRDVAARSGISSSHVNNIEHGRMCSDAAIEAVARVLGYDLTSTSILLPRGSEVRQVLVPVALADAIQDALGGSQERILLITRLLGAAGSLDDRALGIVALQIEAMSTSLMGGEQLRGRRQP